MKTRTDSSLFSLIKSAGKLAGIELIVFSSVLISPSGTLTWLSRNLSSIRPSEHESIIVGSYLVIAAAFMIASVIRCRFLYGQGLLVVQLRPREVIGNLLIITTVLAILVKRYYIRQEEQFLQFDRGVIVIDLIFIWAISDFLVRMTIVLLRFFRFFR